MKIKKIIIIQKKNKSRKTFLKQNKKILKKIYRILYMFTHLLFINYYYM
jgi:hypothetical protein